MNIAIRAATSSDLESLSKVCCKTFVEAYEGKGEDRPFDLAQEYVREKFNVDVLRTEIARASVWIWVLTLDEGIIGYIKLLAESPPPFVSEKNLHQLERIYVLKTHQGLGLGKQLLRKAEMLATENGAKGIWLSTWDENLAAIEFYRKQGYEKAGSQNWEFKVRDFHYVDTDDVMVKVL